MTTTMSDIIQETSIQKGGIYRHFESKEQLMVEAFQFSVETMRDHFVKSVSQHSNAADKLNAFVEAFLQLSEGKPLAGGCPIFNAAIEMDDLEGNVLLPSIKEAMDMMIDSRYRKYQVRPHPNSVQKFKRKLRKLTKRNWSIPLDCRILKLKQVIFGWVNYFRTANMKMVLTEIDKKLRSIEKSPDHALHKIKKDSNGIFNNFLGLFACNNVLETKSQEQSQNSASEAKLSTDFKVVLEDKVLISVTDDK